MPAPLKIGSVAALVEAKGEQQMAEGVMLGYPVRSAGKPVLVELRLDSGRTTVAKFNDVTPLDDAARSLLKGRPPESNA
jgi:hypothetical protein